MIRLRKRPDAWSRAVLRQLAAWCLHYPDDDLRQRLELLEAALAELGTPRMGNSEAATDLRATLEHLRDTPQQAAEQHYIEVFDTKPRRCLYLTWYVHGDTRLRGQALAELAGTFRRHGFRVEGGELPDYLPALLEFTATGGPGAAREGERLLGRFRPAMQLLHRKLTEIGTPYAGAVRAVLATVPAADRAAVPAAPPPSELVGLDPYPRISIPKGSR